MTQKAHPALQCENITVRYGEVTALSDVSVQLQPGLIHAIVGQNGAGKTTFARVAAGLVKPATGNMFVNGNDLPSGSVTKARAAGVELVHQSFALPPSFSVAEAMEFGSTRTPPLFSKRGLNARWAPHLESLNIAVNSRQRIRDLPVETQQAVEIARALVIDAKLLILDEPTSVLSPAGIEKLFARVRKLKEFGVTVVLVLHKIREVLAIADTVTVLRGGLCVAGPLCCTDLTSIELTELIIGQSKGTTVNDGLVALTGAGPTQASHGLRVASRTTEHTKPVLEMSGVTTVKDSVDPALHGLDFNLHPYEIVGVAGIEGNGQRTLVQAIAGLAGLNAGQISITGHSVIGESLSNRRRKGLRIIPFERNVEGLSLTSSLWENWGAGELLQGPLLKPIRPSLIKNDCDAALRSWNVRYHKCTQPAGSLSGGNAQKVILAREIDAKAKLIIAAHPTRGLDIGATAFVWKALHAARNRGCGILLISPDLDELFDNSDRIIVMLSGGIAGEFTGPFDLQKIGAAMIGTVQ